MWSQQSRRGRLLFTHLINRTENGSPPPLTTHDRELVSALEVRIEPWDLNPRPLTLQSVTLPIIPRVGYRYKKKEKEKMFIQIKNI